MGLTSWSRAPDGKILLSDAKIAKNYLTDDEIRSLNRIVNMYLDYAEDRAERQIPMSMKDQAEKLDKFLEFNEYQVLQGKGTISRKEADKFVKKEYETFRVIQDKEFKSDYDEFIELEKNIIN